MPLGIDIAMAARDLDKAMAGIELLNRVESSPPLSNPPFSHHPFPTYDDSTSPAYACATSSHKISILVFSQGKPVTHVIQVRGCAGGVPR